MRYLPPTEVDYIDHSDRPPMMVDGKERARFRVHLFRHIGDQRESRKVMYRRLHSRVYCREQMGYITLHRFWIATCSPWQLIAESTEVSDHTNRPPFRMTSEIRKLRKIYIRGGVQVEIHDYTTDEAIPADRLPGDNLPDGLIADRVETHIEDM